MLSLAVRRLRENELSESKNSATKSLRSDNTEPQLCVQQRQLKTKPIKKFCVRLLNREN